jgi:predicted nuclease of predicted toxin-antitoxin system
MAHALLIGIDSIHVAELGMARARDSDVLDYARTHALVVVTFDADFHMMLASCNASGPSTIRIRIQGLDGKAFASVLDRVAQACHPDLEAGAMVTVSPRGIRVHHLPLVR